MTINSGQKNRKIAAFLLVFAIAFMGCPPEPDENPVYTQLEAKIAEAEIEKDKVDVAEDASEVASDRKWVTAQVMETFNAAINAAQGALTASTQQAVDIAVTTLGNAITVFKNAQQDGNKSSGFTKTELDSLIAGANAAKTGVTVSVNGNDINPSAQWVTQSVLDTFNTAINNAESAQGPDYDSVYNALVTALTNFNSAKQNGSPTETAKTTLNTSINNALSEKEGVVTAESASEVPVETYWVTAAAMTAFNTAVSAAQTVYGNAGSTLNAVNDATTALNNAINTFKTAKTEGTKGPGNASIKISELTEYENAPFAIGLYESTAQFDELCGTQARPKISNNNASDRVQNGILASDLYQHGDAGIWIEGDIYPWIAEGSWYVGIGIQAENHLFGVEFYISKTKIDFTSDLTELNFLNDFKRFYFEISFNELAENLSIPITAETTVDDWMSLSTGGSVNNYAEWSEDFGIHLYKDEGITPLTGSEKALGLTIYLEAPLFMLMGGGPQALPYVYDNVTGVLEFNPERTGIGDSENYVTYAPGDPNCPKWVLEGTEGTFPIGRWVRQGNTSSYSQWIEFDNTGSLKLFTEMPASYTLNEVNKTIETARWGNLPYRQEGNTLIFNPMGRGDNTRAYTPDDPQCDRWELEGPGGTFPIGTWVRYDWAKEWVKFDGSNMIFGREQLYGYTLNDNNITLQNQRP